MKVNFLSQNSFIEQVKQHFIKNGGADFLLPGPEWGYMVFQKIR